MVAAVRGGQSLRAVASQFGVGVATVSHWVKRAKGQRLDRVDWSDRSRTPHQTRRTDTPLEDLVLKTRSDLAQGDLGAIGAAPIRQALLDQGVADPLGADHQPYPGSPRRSGRPQEDSASAAAHRLVFA